ncbi:cupin domain-containing protein, partial [Rhizobium ruizarguesonis]
MRDTLGHQHEISIVQLLPPWSIAFPRQQLLRFHFVSQGPCWINTEAQGWQELNDGDLVLLPQGIAH